MIEREGGREGERERERERVGRKEGWMVRSPPTRQCSDTLLDDVAVLTSNDFDEFEELRRTSVDDDERTNGDDDCDGE